jgi:hypothetical protein
VGWRPDTRHDWGARALALSQWGRDGYVARPLAVIAPELAGVARATPPTPVSCPDEGGHSRVTDIQPLHEHMFEPKPYFLSTFRDRQVFI